MADPFHIHEIQSWLTTPAVSMPEFEHQDGEWVIATNVRCFDLLPLLEQPNCIPSRRDSLIFALMLQLEWLFDPSERMDELYADEETAKAKQKLLRFARDHWPEIQRIEREIGFGADLEKLVALVTINRDDGL